MLGGSENPSMENLFNGDNMSKIFSAISSSVGEMGDSTDLLSEATNICGVMKDNPLFGNLLNMGEGGEGNDMMAQMMQGMMGGMMGGGGGGMPGMGMPGMGVRKEPPVKKMSGPENIDDIVNDMKIDDLDLDDISIASSDSNTSKSGGISLDI